MPLNSYVRRPINLTAYRNRRVVREAPPTKPLPRNTPHLVLRRNAMNDLVGWILLTTFTLGCAAGVSYATFVVNERTAGLELELVVGGVSSVAVMLAGWFIRNAVSAWGAIDRLDEKSRLKNQLLATVVRPVEPKLPLPFTNWLQ